MLLHVLGILVAWRSVQRGQARDLLNEQTGFRSPALEVTFPRLVIANLESEELLEPGVHLGLWTLRPRQDQSDLLEVQLTDRGRRSFSLVGNQIIATFPIGTRAVSQVVELRGSSGSRQVRFRYAWKSLHPDAEVLGSAAPEPDREYEGEALFLYENNRWKVLHWATPDLDNTVARFRTLMSAPGNGG